MATSFTWIPIYQEFADELNKWHGRQEELISFLEGLRASGHLITPFIDKDEEGGRLPLKEIDPFTFFGVFNRGIRNENRLAILGQVKQKFHLKNPLPEDFNGIPILNNQSSWFFSFQGRRKVDDVEKLWQVYQLALKENPLDNQEFAKAFDNALTVRRTNINLTMGLFWIRPNIFLSLDSVNRNYFGINLPAKGIHSQYYLDLLKSVRAKGKSFPELSFEAWLAVNDEEELENAPASTRIKNRNDVNYWLVGAYWHDRDPADQTERFRIEGTWENGYRDRFLDEVKSMQVGDKIAIKAAGTQRRNLPFEAQNQTVSRMTIKAAGTIVANRGDGRTVEVEWDKSFKEKDWYFYTNRMTLWHLRVDQDYRHRELSEKLRDFVWYGKPQDFEWWLKRWGYADEAGSKMRDNEELDGDKQPYSIEDMIASGVFLSETELEQILKRLESKKAMILQGPPGVGKTFVARKLAYALMEQIDNKRLEMIQFHQSYSYDDFVRGYRPMEGRAGSFGLQNGVFYEFCQKAIDDPEREYVFIIDEINRGNLSQILGELLMLIEHDKRSPEFAVPLIYRNDGEARFYVPPNLYLIGLMNVADRSLAMVDYALRRRFVFTTLKPQYESELYRKWLTDRSMKDELASLIIERMTVLNKEIKEDPLLGENYQIGHSFFCPKGDDFTGLDRNWYDGVVRTEIAPLLKEYWFDNQSKAEEAERRLLA